ncbi:hypothetical protein H9P43_000296 [Blastocladiella emersonii ATCC 22665]|nr:hypothetical protein H9P43_000296 [Blastocladiella emersonii ATCC 22665]
MGARRTATKKTTPRRTVPLTTKPAATARYTPVLPPWFQSTMMGDRMHARIDEVVDTFLPRSSTQGVDIMRHLMTTAPGDPSCRQGDMSLIFDQIQRMLDQSDTPHNSGGPDDHQQQQEGSAAAMSPAHFAYTAALAQTNLPLHTKGLVLSADDFALHQMFEQMAPDGMAFQYAPVGGGGSAGATVPAAEVQLLDALRRGYCVDASAIMRVLRDKPIDMFGRRFLNSMHALLAILSRPGTVQYRGNRVPLVVMWDANLVTATAEQIAVLDAPWFDVRVYGTAAKQVKWSAVLGTRETFKTHTVAIKSSVVLKSRVLAHLAAVLNSTKTVQPVVLVSGNAAFEGIEDMARREVKLGKGTGAGGIGGDPDRWVLHLRSSEVAAFMIAWAELCVTGGSDEGKTEWRAHAAAAAPATAAKASAG